MLGFGGKVEQHPGGQDGKIYKLQEYIQIHIHEGVGSNVGGGWGYVRSYLHGSPFTDRLC